MNGEGPAAAPLAVDTVVAVVGAGAMGSGIAQVAARAGHRVLLHDSQAGAVERGLAGVRRDLEALVARGRLPAAEAAAIVARIAPAARLEDLAPAGLVVEAVVEDLAIKRQLFAGLEDVVDAGAVLATNTSSLSITAIAAGLARPQRLLGLHFFNPAPRMALVEVVTGLATDPVLATRLLATAHAWGKRPVLARSTPGFIVNRVARPYYAEALRVLAEGAASIATLDAILREGCRFPMGPFELMDLIGHDVNFAVTRSVFDAFFGDRRFAPSLIQQELVQAGRLGRKSGRGFYDHGEGAARPAPQTLAPRPRPAAVQVVGDLGVAAPLADRWIAAGVPVAAVPAAMGADPPAAGWVEVGDACLALSDGRCAGARALDEGRHALVLFDLAFDFAHTARLAVARADGCPPAAFDAAVGALQAAGIEVSEIDDVAGLIGLRTVCMLANEAADAVLQAVASAADIDTAMCHGTNHPRGPLAWAGVLGHARVAQALRNLHDHYGDERYRVSPWLARQARRPPSPQAIAAEEPR